MQKFIIALTIVISIVLESAFFPFISLAGVVPNLTMILVICLALRQDNDKGALIGFAAGLTKDIVVGRMIGVSGITFMLIGYFIGKYNHKIFPDHLTTPLILTLLGTLFHEGVYLLFVFFMGYQIDLLLAVSQVWIVQVIYNFLMVLPVYVGINKLYHWHVMKKQY